MTGSAPSSFSFGTPLNEIIIQANWTVGAREHNGFECNEIRHSGFSNSRILQLRNSQGAFAVRSWPNSATTWDKILFWNECNRQFELSTPDPMFPHGSPFPKLFPWKIDSNKKELLLNYEGQLWSLCRWIPGESIGLGDVSLDLIRHLAAVLAKIHLNSIGFVWNSANASVQQSSIGLIERHRHLASLKESLLIPQLPRQWLCDYELESLVLRAVRNLFKLQTEWTRFLHSTASQKRTNHWIVRDAWYSNILIERASFSGIVDLGAARCDWPGLDFVRLIGSVIALGNPMIGDSAHVWWSEAWQTYTERHVGHALNTIDECILLDEISCGLSIAQWMQWIHEGRFTDSDKATNLRVARRLKELCTHFGAT